MTKVILQILAKEFPGTAAGNPATPPEVLRKLSDKAVYPETGASMQTLPEIPTPPDTLMNLANHENATVRTELAKNPATSRDLLAVLAEDLDADVSEAALQRL
jgi:hypothetical protein